MLLTGLLECLTRLHEWQHGLDKEKEWLPQATQVIRDIMAQHARDARTRGITPEEHVCKVIAVPG